MTNPLIKSVSIILFLVKCPYILVRFPFLSFLVYWIALRRGLFYEIKYNSPCIEDCSSKRISGNASISASFKTNLLLAHQVNCLLLEVINASEPLTRDEDLITSFISCWRSIQKLGKHWICYGDAWMQLLV